MPDEATRVCFYIRDDISPESWEVEFPSPDVATLNLRQRYGGVESILHIHNVYNPIPDNRNNLAGPSSIPLLTAQIGKHPHDSHIVVGDFNLHHPYWGGPGVLNPHPGAEALLECAAQAQLELCLQAGSVTREQGNSRSTLDLVFATQDVFERLTRCAVREDLGQGSDHYPVETVITTDHVRATPRRSRLFKKLDTVKLLRCLEGLLPAPRPLEEPPDIDRYTQEIVHAINIAIEESTPLMTLTQRSRPGWTQECSEAVRAEKQARRRWKASRTHVDHELYKEARRTKSKTISTQKTILFRQGIKDLTEDPRAIWRLTGWAKDQSMRPKCVPQFPTLIEGEFVATSFEDKVSLLRRKFFPPPHPAVLDDIATTALPPRSASSHDLTDAEITHALFSTKPDKAPGPDAIPTRVLQKGWQALREPTCHLFRACVALGYHPHHFKDSFTVVIKKPGREAGDYTSTKGYRPVALLNTLGKVLEKVLAKRLSFLAETQRLLPECQMGARRRRSTGTALELLTAQVETV